MQMSLSERTNLRSILRVEALRDPAKQFYRCERGTVKLAKTARFSPPARSARARSAGARHRIPLDEPMGSQRPVVRRPQQVPTRMVSPGGLRSGFTTCRAVITFNIMRLSS